MNELRAGEIHNLSSSSQSPALPERTLLVAILERATLDAYGLVTATSGDSESSNHGRSARLDRCGDRGTMVVHLGM